MSDSQRTHDACWYALGAARQAIKLGGSRSFERALRLIEREAAQAVGQTPQLDDGTLPEVVDAAADPQAWERPLRRTMPPEYVQRQNESWRADNGR